MNWSRSRYSTPLLRLVAQRRRLVWRKQIRYGQRRANDRQSRHLIQLAGTLAAFYLCFLGFYLTRRFDFISLYAGPFITDVFKSLVWVGLTPLFVELMEQISARLAPRRQSEMTVGDRRRRPLQVFVQGPFSGTEKIDVHASTTTGDVKMELRRRHLIGPIGRCQYNLIYPPFSFASLADETLLQSIGVSDLSLLQLRVCLPGGSQRREHRTRAPGARFTPQNGRFPSRDANVWRPDEEINGKFRCLPCNANRSIEARFIPEHEKSGRHVRNLHAWMESQRGTGTPDIQGPSTSQSQVQGHLLRALASLVAEERRPDAPSDFTNMQEDVAWGEMDFGDDDHQEGCSQDLVEQLRGYLNGDLDLEGSSEGEGCGDCSDLENSDTESPVEVPDSFVNLFHHRRSRKGDVNSEWYPWPDRETCVLDILRHVPRCAFSRKQNLAIHWAMVALGVPNLPSDRAMDDIDAFLQKLCGIQSIRYTGAFGHVYYVNDFAGIIRQEMANPQVRDKLHFYPEDSGTKLCQAWQAERWKKEMDPHLLTPMVRVLDRDFYTFEPCLLDDGRVCMPARWFTRDGQIWALMWGMKVETNPESGKPGWLVQSWETSEVHHSRLLLSFEQLKELHQSYNLPSPQSIIGEELFQDNVVDWMHTNPVEGNRWRARSQGKRVLAFPIWLYCDDTSGNVSKKWNKHNSFLFTAAGLPRRYVHQESNIHFLCTSNTAPPLEMLDGIVEQLETGQRDGIWAWDCIDKEMVLLIPSVLAMLGDNPMQSELACHIGFRGKLFCRVCWVQGSPEDEQDPDGCDPLDDTDRMSVASSTGSTGKKRKGTLESMSDMLARVKQFVTKSRSRDREQTCENLRSQFALASKIGGIAAYKREKTATGIKDVYLEGFVNQIATITTRKGRDLAQKERDLAELQAKFPAEVTSPVWRIKGLDPHADTPVEILHVILLGFVKYFWRDAVARTKKNSDLLSARLSSFDTSGLGISRLAGPTLVNYAGSLTGRDFRAIAQAAPFVLQGLISDEQMAVWHALSAVVTLAWQPEILNIEEYLDKLERAIDHFLDCTCRLTPRWFNKPKFHVILHLPNHIRRFGPPMLFATEGFESFNAIIRGCSVHSNRHAPSKDVAHRMARGNRIRHLMKGGFIPRPQSKASDLTSPHASEIKAEDWMAVSASVQSMSDLLDFRRQLLGLDPDGDRGDVMPGLCVGKISSEKHAAETETARYISDPVLASGFLRVCEGVVSQSGDICYAGNWVACDVPGASRPRIGRVIEILQVVKRGSAFFDMNDKVDFVTIQWAIMGELHPKYNMFRLHMVDECILVPAKDIRCLVNVQHNCVDHKCPVTRSAIRRLEREIINEKALAVQHREPHSDLILNTAQMRSAAYTMSLRPPIATLDRTKIIEDSVRAEIDLRKKTQAKKTSSATAKGSATQKSPSGGRPPALTLPQGTSVSAPAAGGQTYPLAGGSQSRWNNTPSYHFLSEPSSRINSMVGHFPSQPQGSYQSTPYQAPVFYHYSHSS